MIVLDTENIEGDIKLDYKNSKMKIFTFEEVMDAGADKILPWASVKPSSIYAFSYTSGTTGDSKGAMISH